MSRDHTKCTHSRWYQEPGWWQVILAIFSLLIALVGATYTYKQWRSATIEAARKQDAIVADSRALRTRIFQPRDGDTVRSHMFVSGYSSYPEWHNYLFVTDVVTGTKFLQHGEIDVESNGYWSQAADFGEAMNCDIEFLVTEVASREAIPGVTVEHFPREAVITPSIRVVREPCK